MDQCDNSYQHLQYVGAPALLRMDRVGAVPNLREQSLAAPASAGNQQELLQPQARGEPC